MTETFTAVLELARKTATGIEVPPAVVDGLPPSARTADVTSVEGTAVPETRARRVAEVVAFLAGPAA